MTLVIEKGFDTYRLINSYPESDKVYTLFTVSSIVIRMSSTFGRAAFA